MPTTCTPVAPWAVAKRSSSGISSMHGPHQEAQTLTSMVRPACSEARVVARPSRSGSSIAGISSPRLATATPAGGSGADAEIASPSRRWPSSVRSKGPGPEVIRLATMPSVPAPMATSTTLVDCRISARPRGPARALRELAGLLETHQPQAAQLRTVDEEQRTRRADDAEALHQRLVDFVVGSDVGLQQHEIRQCGLHVRIGEGVLLHFLAAHAPVGIEVEHQRLAARACRGKFAIQVVAGL